MWPRLSSERRRFLTNLILDAAAALPPKKRGPLHALQSIRQRQQSAATRVVSETKAPHGMLFDYLGFVSVELFPIEQTPKLIEGLQRLFRLSPDAEELSKIREYPGHPDIISWQEVGLISRDSSMPFGPWRTHRVMPKLPEHIAHARVYVNKRSPSMVSLHVAFYLKHTINGAIQRFMESPILAPTELTDFRPRYIGYSRAEFSADVARSLAARKFFETMRREAEDTVLRDFRRYGYLSRDSLHTALPAIAIFELSGLPNPHPDNWLPLTRPWRYGLGLDFDHDYYAETGVALGTERWSEPQQPVVWPFLLATDPSTDANAGSIDSRFERMENAYDSLDLTSYIVAVKAYALSVEQRIEDFRRSVQSRRMRGQLAHDARVIERILNEKLLVERLVSDTRLLMQHPPEDALLDSLRYRSAFVPGMIGDSSAATWLLRSAKENFERLLADINDIVDFFSAIVSARNVGTTFITAIWALIVAVLSLVVAITFGALSLRH